MKNVFWTERGGDALDDAIVLGTQKGKRGHQGACADARDDLELGSSPVRGPSNQ